MRGLNQKDTFLARGSPAISSGQERLAGVGGFWRRTGVWLEDKCSWCRGWEKGSGRESLPGTRLLATPLLVEHRYCGRRRCCTAGAESERHSRGAAASWHPRALLQQQQETWHFECIVPASKMHFRDVTLMGLCVGTARLWQRGFGNFYSFPGQKTWHQCFHAPLSECQQVLFLYFFLCQCGLTLSVPLSIRPVKEISGGIISAD